MLDDGRSVLKIRLRPRADGHPFLSTHLGPWLWDYRRLSPLLLEVVTFVGSLSPGSFEESKRHDVGITSSATPLRKSRGTRSPS